MTVWENRFVVRDSIVIHVDDRPGVYNPGFIGDYDVGTGSREALGGAISEAEGCM